jgi:hypothetical protein
MELSKELQQKILSHFGCNITESDCNILKILKKSIDNSGVFREGWLSTEEEETLKKWQNKGCIRLDVNNIVISKEMYEIILELFPE